MLRTTFLFSLLMITWFGGVPQAFSQTSGNRPQLANRDTGNERVYTDGRGFYYIHPDTRDIVLPVEEHTSITVSLNLEFSTKGMSDRDALHYPLESINPVRGRYDLYLEGRELVTVRFTGKKAGIFSRAYFEANPVTVVARFTKSVVIGLKNGLPVLLQPGTYKITLYGQLHNIQTQGRFNMTLPLDAENRRVKAPRFGPGNQGGICEDRVAPMVSTFIVSLPAYALCQGGKLLGILFQRPNWVLPSGTYLTFHIDRMTATRLPEGAPNFDELRPVSN